MSGSQLPQIVIVGRPNVGKSTLFNRIIGRRQAIVGEESGLTRDRNIATAEWGGRQFELSDTGGVEWKSKDGLTLAVEAQALGAIDGAAVVLFVVDGREGPVSIERDLAAELRRAGARTFLLVNKCDNAAAATTFTADFASFGVTPVFPIAAEHGNGVADVLDAIVEILPEVAIAIDEEPTGDYTRVAVVGRPNVGKSSLANAMIGSQRHVVSDVSGTTRDAIDTTITYKDRDYVLVDTAGIRRGARQDGFAEFVSVAIARKRMARADVALLVIDATVGLTRQDRSVADEAQTAGCGLVVVVNKWDLVDVERGDSRSWHKELRERLGRMAFAEVVYTSALKGDGVQALFATINRVAENRLRRVPTGELNGFFEHLLRRGPQGPPGAPELKYLTQVSVGPPTFVFFAGKGRRDMPTSYTRFLENRLRENFTLGGTPVRIIIRRREQRAR